MPLATRTTPTAPIAIVSNVLRFMVGPPAIRAGVPPVVPDLAGPPAFALGVLPLLGRLARRRAPAEPSPPGRRAVRRRGKIRPVTRARPRPAMRFRYYYRETDNQQQVEHCSPRALLAWLGFAAQFPYISNPESLASLPRPIVHQKSQ